VVSVAIDSRTGSFDRLLHYSVASPLPIGSAVIVPFGKREVLGFVFECFPASESELAFDGASLRPIVDCIGGLDLPPQSIQLAKIVAETTLSSIHTALSVMIPHGARERLVQVWSITGQPITTKKSKSHFELETEDDRPISPQQKEILRVIRDAGGSISGNPARKLEASSVRGLLALQKLGLVKRETRYQPVQERRDGEEFLRLCPDSLQIDTFLKNESRRKPAQALVILRLQETANSSGFTASEIKALAGVTDATIRSLLSEKILTKEAEQEDHLQAVTPIPNRYQVIAIEAISEAIAHQAPLTFLLFGITGSGKTEVYLQSAAQAIRQGRQVLYLVPEIVLATQAISRLRERYGNSVAVIHSELTSSERLLSYQRIRDGKATLVLGARSGLFAPFNNLGLIVVDEEHEQSYKQDSVPRYSSVEVAQTLGRIHSCPVVLGSATPSVESFYAAEEGRFTLLSLPERAASAKLPEVFLDDLTVAYRNKIPAILGEQLFAGLTETIAKGNQAILFLNRRAYAPFLLCRDCGWRSPCPRCAVTLSFHASEMILRCHHCGHSEKPPDICPSCGNPRVNPIGVGTEKVEEAVKEAFPGIRVGRVDRDVARKKGQLEQALALFRSGEIQVLVGTQMVAKGLDFPNVTFVGVVMADISLNLPDFRASEKTFQLLSQVAGRAGRSEKIGKVVIQTFNPEHPSIVAAKIHNYLSFYEAMIIERRQAQYPPFRKLVNIVMTSESRPAVVLASEEVANRLEKQNPNSGGSFEILGPVDCVLERLKERWRRHVLVKLAPDSSAHEVREALLGFAPHDVQVVVDVNPYSMM